MIKKIYTILVLIKNVLIKKRHYTLSFFAEFDKNLHKTRWFYDFKHWGFDKANLEMVSGADNLCTHYALGNSYLTVDIVASQKQMEPALMEDFDMYVGENMDGMKLKDKLLYGRTYTNVTTDKDAGIHVTTMWICPVTLFVLGRYPNYIYIKRK